MQQLITETIPARVAADTAFRNARQNSDPQNARIEHDKALLRVMTAVMRDDTELFKQFMDNAQLQALAQRHRILARLRAGKHSVKHLPTQGCEEWSSQTPAAQGQGVVGDLCG